VNQLTRYKHHFMSELTNPIAYMVSKQISYRLTNLHNLLVTYTTINY